MLALQASELAEALAVNNSLEVVDIMDSKVGPDAMRVVIDAVKTRPRLSTLKVEEGYQRELVRATKIYQTLSRIRRNDHTLLDLQLGECTTTVADHSLGTHCTHVLHAHALKSCFPPPNMITTQHDHHPTHYHPTIPPPHVLPP
jgi:hypothetical protein